MGSWTGGCRVRLEKGLEAACFRLLLGVELACWFLTRGNTQVCHNIQDSELILPCITAVLVYTLRDRDVVNGPGPTLRCTRCTRPCLIGFGLPGHRLEKTLCESIQVLLHIDEVDAALPSIAYRRVQIGLVEYNSVETNLLILAAIAVYMDALGHDIVRRARHKVPGGGHGQPRFSRVDENGTGADIEPLWKSIMAVRVEAAEGSHIRDGPPRPRVCGARCHSLYLVDCVLTVLLDDTMTVQ